MIDQEINERQRRAALAAYEILDTPSDVNFDNITLLAAQICEAPVAFVTFVDADRLWFKSRHGIALEQLPREVSFFSRAAEWTSEFLEIPDARVDPRFSDHPLVVGSERLVSYSGIALTAEGGHRLGALGVMDRRPRRLNEAQRRALRALTDQVEALLEVNRTNVRLAETSRDNESKRRELQTIFDASAVGMALVREPAFVFEQVNAAFAAMASPREYLRRDWRSVFHDAPDPKLFDRLTVVYRTRARHLEREKAVDTIDAEGGRKRRYFNVTYDWIEGVDADHHGVLIQAVDVTDTLNARRLQECAHAELIESRQRLEESLKMMPVSVAFLEGPEHRYTFTNEVHARLFGGRQNFLGKTVVEAAPELRNHQVMERLARVYHRGESVLEEEMRVELGQADGSLKEFFLKVGYQPMRDVSGRIIGIVSTAADVTGIVRAREEVVRQNALVSETQRLLSEATRVARVGFYEWRIDDNVVFFSEQMQRDWDVPAGLPLEKSIERIHPGDREQVQRCVARSVETGEPFLIEYRLYWPETQKLIWIEAQGKVTYDSAGRPLSFVGTSIDITSRKTVETDAQALANSMAQLAWMADADGRIFWFNQRWYEYTGLSIERMRGGGWKQVHAPEHVGRVREKFSRHLKTGEPWEDTFPLRGADGQFRWFLSRAVPIRDDGGNVVRWFGTNTDITVHREAELELARMAAVIESCKDFIAITDSRFRPVMANAGARAMIGLGAHELDGLSIGDWFAPDERERLRETIVPHMLEHGYWEGEARFRALDTGRILPVLFNLFPVKNPSTDETIAYATVTRDISERKAFERSLSEAKESAERANLAKSAFLANMSHEIRSPLGAIMGFSDLLRGAEIGANDFVNFIDVIQRNATHLLRIVDDILDLSKVEAGKMLIEDIEFSLREVLADFTSLMTYRARDKGIEFKVILPAPIPDRVRSDPTRLRQILTNVVGNAVKFTERGRVTLTVRRRGDRLAFEVEDTGPGIPPEHAARLFRPFEQADASTTRRFGGTGLGLVLTRRLAESMGGEFELRSSEVGRGSVFVVSIAVGRSADASLIDASALRLSSPAAPAAPKGRLAGMKILVIEDSPDNQELFRLTLNGLGARVEIAADGVEGVATALARDFDAILCDVQMPRMDGYEATRALRERGYKKPIIALTAHAMKEERDRALASGFTDFLSKPLHRELLIRSLRTHVARDR